MENAIIKKSFVFNSVKIRTAIIDGEPWFVAKDVCEVLELGNITEALRGLDADELTSEILKSGEQGREMRLINESGLYALVFKSRKPEAKAFRKWVTSTDFKKALINHGLKENETMTTSIVPTPNYSNFGKSMSSREIAELTGKAHRHILEDIRSLINQGAISEPDFRLSDYKDASGKSNPMYLLDFKATMTLVTGYNAMLRAKVIDRWYELETKTGRYGNVPKLPQNYEEALEELLKAVKAERMLKEKNQKLLVENNKLQKSNLSKSLTITRNKPKVLFADAVSASNTSILVGDLARILKQNGINIGQNRLFVWMRENGYLIKKRRADYNMPTQKSMNAGLFEIKESVVNNPDGSIYVTRTPKVTGAGQVFFINQFLCDKK